jgi:hypothetical protein
MSQGGLLWIKNLLALGEEPNFVTYLQDWGNNFL